jgi:protoporphyrinogen oxidase
MDDVGIEERLYDTVIIGGGIAGLTAAYMLRDKEILLLEREDRFGGRVLSEKVNEATNNIGTQFFTEEDTSFVRLVDELGIERVSHDVNSAPFALYLDNQLYTDFGSLFSVKVSLRTRQTERYGATERFRPGDPGPGKHLYAGRMRIKTGAHIRRNGGRFVGGHIQNRRYGVRYRRLPEDSRCHGG